MLKLKQISGSIARFAGFIKGSLYEPNTNRAQRHADKRSDPHDFRPPSRDILGSKVLLFTLAFACGLICLARAIFLSESGRGEAVFFYIVVGIALIFYGGVGGGMAIS